MGGAGASAGLNFDPKKGKIKAKIEGNLQGKLVAFEGKYVARWGVPSLNGWMMKAAGEELGPIRFLLEAELYGFVGAKGVLSCSLGFSIDPKTKMKERAQKIGEAASAAKQSAKNALSSSDGKQPVFDPAALNESAPKDVDGINGDLDLFAGAEAGLKPKGALQWLPPGQKEFVSFAEISGDVAVSAGASAKGQLAIYYQNGKFRIKASARLCWGLGAKVGTEFMVDVAKVLEFCKWVYNQLLLAGFKQLIYIQKAAFDALSQVLFMVIAKDSNLGRFLEEEAMVIDETFDGIIKEFELAKTRSEMVARINKAPPWLVYATPETRGMLLYQIIRHSKQSHLRDWPTTTLEGLDPQWHYLPSHKEAILNIMRGVHTCPEWHNVMQHISAKGTKSTQNPGKNEGDVLRLLNHGVSLAELPDVMSALNKSLPAPDKSGNTYLDQYLKLRKGLKDAFPKGYQLAQNGTPEFEFMPDGATGKVHESWAVAAMSPEVNLDLGGWGDDTGILGQPRTAMA